MHRPPPSSKSNEEARACNFTEEDGTLGETFDIIAKSDLVMLLISDAAQAKMYPRILAAHEARRDARPQPRLPLGVMSSDGEDFRDDINVILVAPKGMGPSVRRLYEQGKEVGGSGINASFAVHQDATGSATDIALGWSIAVGSPFTFATTLEMEYRSDIFGERGILLGGVHGIVESLYRRYVKEGMSEEDAFKNTVECITGPITKTISTEGIKAVYEKVPDKAEFMKAYPRRTPARTSCTSATRRCSPPTRSQRGDGVRALRQVPDGQGRHLRHVKAGEKVRAERVEEDIPLNSFTAGVYRAHGGADRHPAREGPLLQRGVQRVPHRGGGLLNPVHARRGVAFMVDNCSYTARLGSRKWAPRFDYNLEQQAYVAVDQGGGGPGDGAGVPQQPGAHRHRQLLRLRPSVASSVQVRRREREGRRGGDVQDG